MRDKIFELIEKEKVRQKTYVELIASENFVSKDILEVDGSILTNKYAEGYPYARYYGGCEFVDQIEDLARERLKKLFKVKYVNVQPHSGTQANTAAYMAILKPGDKILGMSLNSGGHLTHGYFITSSGIIYNASHYEVDKKTKLLDYDQILKIAQKVKPKLIICGASSYPREINFKKFREIADKVGAFLMADMAHIAGLVATGLHQSPIPYCDIVTSTTHKTLRGPRGGIIMTNNLEISQKIDKALFPGTQGGPLMHIIAAKAIAFNEANKKEFKEYQKQILKNSKAMSKWFVDNGAFVSTNGTDNHLFLVDVKKSFGITGKRAEELLFHANIVVNKNSIPFDEEKPSISSGIRIGTPAMTTKGFKEKDFILIAKIIFEVLKNNEEKFAKIKSKEILEILKKERKWL